MNNDIVVIGAGPAALSFARSMKSSSLRIKLLEQAPEQALSEPKFDGRDIALTHASKSLLQQLGVWQDIDPTQIHPIRKASVVDGESSEPLEFDCERKQYQALGYIVSNHLIKQALFQGVMEQDNVDIECGCKVTGIEKTEAGYRVKLEDGRSYTTPLLVAADSRFSSTRSQAGIAADINDFARTAIVCRMQHKPRGEATAFECFHYGHTLAILPLGDRESSVVVTANTDHANRLLALDDAQFCDFVMEQFGDQLGSMTLSSERFSYPLVGVHARQFVREHFALIGDAAVGMHPVTAHGFNLGLSSAHLLARQIVTALDNHQPYYSEQNLKGYQKKHILETRVMYYGTNGIVKLFTDDKLPGRLARKVALGLSRRCPPIKWAIERKLTDLKAGL